MDIIFNVFQICFDIFVIAYILRERSRRKRK